MGDGSGTYVSSGLSLVVHAGTQQQKMKVQNIANAAWAFVTVAQASARKKNINIKVFLTKSRKTRKTKKTRENQRNSGKPYKPKNTIKTRKTRKTKKPRKTTA